MIPIRPVDVKKTIFGVKTTLPSCDSVCVKVPNIPLSIFVPSEYRHLAPGMNLLISSCML
jgi:hypothetical protein